MRLAQYGAVYALICSAWACGTAAPNDPNNPGDPGEIVTHPHDDAGPTPEAGSIDGGKIEPLPLPAGETSGVGDWDQNGVTNDTDQVMCEVALANAASLASYRVSHPTMTDAQFVAMADASGDNVARVSTLAGSPNPDCVALADLRTAPRIAQVTTGALNSCVVMSDGVLRCWGANQMGDLGLGDTTPRGAELSSMTQAFLPPVKVGGNNLIVRSVAIAHQHVCAIRATDNQVLCWGDNQLGQLGYGDSVQRGHTAASMASLGPINLGAGRSAKALAAGSMHTCALLDNDQIKCWGANGSGQLGYGDKTPRPLPEPVATVNLNVNSTIHTAKAISAGGHSSCAILDDGTVTCWGLNDSGQLGLGDIKDRLAPSGNLRLGPGGTFGAAKALSLSNNHACAIFPNDQIRCWGDNLAGQLGYDDTLRRGDASHTPGELADVNLGAGRTVKQVAAGYEHSCALLDDDQVRCWGSNTTGQLGRGNTQSVGNGVGNGGARMSSLVPIPLGTERSVRSLSSAAGGNHPCVLLNNNYVKCWGTNGAGVLGVGGAGNLGIAPNQMGDFLPYVALNRIWKLTGDANHDCVVDALDTKLVSANTGSPGPRGDVNYDGRVDSLDTDLVSPNLNKTCQ